MRNAFNAKIEPADIAHWIFRWLYSRPLSMKVSRTIVRALLLISLLCPFGLQANGSRVSSPSCRVPRHITAPRRQSHAGRSSLHAVLAASAERAPAQRIHRHRGKRVHLDSLLVLAPASRTIAAPTVSHLALHTQNLNGPNPPRGPPTLPL